MCDTYGLDLATDLNLGFAGHGTWEEYYRACCGRWKWPYHSGDEPDPAMARFLFNRAHHALMHSGRRLNLDTHEFFFSATIQDYMVEYYCQEVQEVYMSMMEAIGVAVTEEHPRKSSFHDLLKVLSDAGLVLCRIAKKRMHFDVSKPFVVANSFEEYMRVVVLFGRANGFDDTDACILAELHCALLTAAWASLGGVEQSEFGWGASESQFEKWRCSVDGPLLTPGERAQNVGGLAGGERKRMRNGEGDEGGEDKDMQMG